MTAGRATMALLTLALLLTGCGAPPSPPPPAGCPAGGWDAALLWSSETEPAGEVVFTRGDRVAGRQALPYVGLEAAPTEGLYRTPTATWLKSNGNANRDRTHVVRYATDTCTAQAFAVTEPVLRSVSMAEDAFTTTNTLNGAAEVRRRTLDGTLTRETRFPGLTLTALAPAAGSLYALGTTMGSDADTAVLVELDAVSLDEKRRITLPDVAGSNTLIAQGDTLYYPQTVVHGPGNSEREGVRLGVVTLPDLTLSTVDLGVEAPDVLAPVGADLYIAHNFMNPGFRDTDDYDTLTRYSPARGTVDRFEVGRGLLTLAAHGDRLFVVNQTAQGTPTLTTYRLPDMEKVTTVEVPPPAGGHYYVAGILTPPEPA